MSIVAKALLSVAAVLVLAGILAMLLGRKITKDRRYDLYGK